MTIQRSSVGHLTIKSLSSCGGPNFKILLLLCRIGVVPTPPHLPPADSVIIFSITIIFTIPVENYTLVTNMSSGDILSASGDGWIAAYFITSWEIHPFVQPLRLSLYGTDFFIRRPRCPKTHILADGPCIKILKITPIV